MWVAAGKDPKKFDAYVRQLEGFTRVIREAGLVVERFFSTANYR